MRNLSSIDLEILQELCSATPCICVGSGSTCNSSSICCHFFLASGFRHNQYNTDSKDCLFDGIMVSLEYGILKNCYLFMKTGLFLNKVSSWIHRPILEILFSRLNQIYANLDPHVFKGRFHAGEKDLRPCLDCSLALHSVYIYLPVIA